MVDDEEIERDDGMINCPKCGHPVSGRARSCGYCGESLVNNYFAREERHKGKDPLLEAPAGAAGICAMVLGIFGCLALLAALAFQLMVMFGYGGSVPPEIDRGWWIRTLVVGVPSVGLLVQEGAGADCCSTVFGCLPLAAD